MKENSELRERCVAKDRMVKEKELEVTQTLESQFKQDSERLKAKIR
jgi:hypothetical protein